MIARDTGRITVALAVGTTIAGSFPVFLASALFVQFQRDVGAATWVLGAAVAVYWAAAAVVSMASGRLIAAIGSRRATIVSLVTAVVSLLGLAFVMPTWVFLLVWGAVGGAGNGLGHPASNHLMSLRVSPTRIATALGIKQGAVPFAAFVAGLTVPVLALTVGWQWGFALGAGICVVLLVLFLRLGPRRVAQRVRKPHVPLPPELRRYLLLIACVTTLGAGAAGAASSYSVTVGISRGIDDGWAGVLLSAGSLLGAAARVIVGRIADRTGGRHALPMAGGMLAAGGVGLLLLAIPSPVAFVLGVLLALGVGWGWTGLTHYVVTRVAGPATPSATGLVQTGSYLGSGAGPLLFGLAFTVSHDPLDWVVVGCAQLVSAAIAFALARRPAPVIPTTVTGSTSVPAGA